MYKHVIIMIIGIVLVGCTPRIRYSTARVVTIDNIMVDTVHQAQAMADQECAKSGRYAIHRPDTQPYDGMRTYECIE